MTDVNYPSPAIAASDSWVAIPWPKTAPAIRGGTEGDIGPILGHCPARFDASLAA